jgi:hypothetical protein
MPCQVDPRRHPSTSWKGKFMILQNLNANFYFRFLAYKDNCCMYTRHLVRYFLQMIKSSEANTKSTKERTVDVWTKIVCIGNLFSSEYTNYRYVAQCNFCRKNPTLYPLRRSGRFKREQCCESGSLRSRNFLPDPELEILDLTTEIGWIVHN